MVKKKGTSKKAFRNANRERQAAYRDKIRTGELKRVQMVLPLDVGIKIDYLTEALGCNKVDLFSRLILEEWNRQGQPIPGIKP